MRWFCQCDAFFLIILLSTHASNCYPFWKLKLKAACHVRFMCFTQPINKQTNNRMKKSKNCKIILTPFTKQLVSVRLFHVPNNIDSQSVFIDSGVLLSSPHLFTNICTSMKNLYVSNMNLFLFYFKFILNGFAAKIWHAC